MKRNVMSSLQAWKVSTRRKPLLLEGPRQVGKTWLLQEFGRLAYETTAYVDFEATPSLCTIFEGDFDLARIIGQLEIATRSVITPHDTLIVLDEIQACPQALKLLKYFTSDYHIACAGSLLGVALHEQSSFPVGSVNFITVGPLTVTEFLHAIGQTGLAEAIINQDWQLLAPFHAQLVQTLSDYLIVGGMPEPVSNYAQNHSYTEAREIQQEILRAYDRDFSKHAPPEQVPRIRDVWQSIPAQLAKEQRRFSYGQLGSGARTRTHRAAIEWLAQAGVVMEVKRVSVPRLPLSGYADRDAFKLYLADVGLLGALAGLSVSTVLEGNRLFTEFRGSLAEQFAAQHLFSSCGTVPYYWTNDGGTAEVDFVVQREHDIVPVEVKASRNLKAKSLRVYQDKFDPRLIIRTSLAQFEHHENLVDLPLYGLETMPTLH